MLPRKQNLAGPGNECFRGSAERAGIPAILVGDRGQRARSVRRLADVVDVIGNGARESPTVSDRVAEVLRQPGAREVSRAVDASTPGVEPADVMRPHSSRSCSTTG